MEVARNLHRRDLGETIIGLGSKRLKRKAAFVETGRFEQLQILPEEK